MLIIKKILFWLSITFLFCFIVIPIIGYILGVEFNNMELELLYEQIRFYGVPVAILLFLPIIIKKKDSNYEKGLKIALTITVSGISFVILFFMIWISICNWSNREILFRDTRSDNVIMLRDYGCGALDSEEPLAEIHKIEYYSTYFIRATPIDTLKIDMGKWVRQ